MRIFQDRNPSLVSAILFADAVNPDYVDGVGFGNRFRSNPVNFFGAFILVPMLRPVFMVLAGASLSPFLDFDPKDTTDIKNFGAVYSYIVATSQWFETSDDEWITWPEHAARTSECGVHKNGTIGDLPIHVFVAQKSEAFETWEETLAVREISTASNVTLLQNAPHSFIFEYEYTDVLGGALLDLMAKSEARWSK